MMKKQSFIFIFTFIAIISQSTVQLCAQISEAEGKRIVSFLADDQLKGRASGTEGLYKSADFIAQEFEKAGLQTVDSLGGYFQDFPMLFTTYGEQFLQLNKRTISKSDFFTITDNPSVYFKKAKDMHVVFLDAASDLKKFIEGTQKETKPTVVVVPTSMKSAFQYWHQYYWSSKPRWEKSEGHFSVWILADDKEVKKIKLRSNRNVSEKPIRNIIGILPGKGKAHEKVMFSAHYDHLGILPTVEGDSIANGADDNATGVAAVIQLAQYFKQKNTHQRTIVFTVFDGEELGLIGSQYFAEHIQPQDYKAVINIEMLGKPMSIGRNKAFITGDKHSNLIQIMAKGAKPHRYKFVEDPYEDMMLYQASDNFPLAQKGIVAHTVSSTPVDFDVYYHTINDELETINFKNMASLVKAIAYGTNSIVEGKAIPIKIAH